MNNRQLQEAIDKTRDFLTVTGTAAGPLYQAREESKKHLAQLEAIQRGRAQLASTPRVTLEDIK
jgi:hypothetical protein